MSLTQILQSESQIGVVHVGVHCAIGVFDVQHVVVLVLHFVGLFDDVEFEVDLATRHSFLSLHEFRFLHAHVVQAGVGLHFVHVENSFGPAQEQLGLQLLLRVVIISETWAALIVLAHRCIQVFIPLPDVVGAVFCVLFVNFVEDGGQLEGGIVDVELELQVDGELQRDDGHGALEVRGVHRVDRAQLG